MNRNWMMTAALLAAINTAAAEAPEVPVKAFIDLCMSTGGVPDMVREAALRQGLTVAALEQKAHLTRGRGGRCLCRA